MVNLLSVQLSEELIQEIHDISYWNEFEAQIDIILTEINVFLNFSKS